jgi:hypothetical protein
MRRVSFALAALFVICGVGYGQEDGARIAEELKCYRPFIGTWRYEGPLLEELPGLAEKGTDCVIQFSWRRILDGRALESRVAVEVDGKGEIYAERSLVAWNAAEQKIVYAGASSDGSIFLGVTEADADAKTLHPSCEGSTGEGKRLVYRGVFTITDENTMTWQALERTGSSIIEGPSPLYTFQKEARRNRPRGRRQTDQ